MRSTRYPEDVILCLLGEAEAGTPLDQVCGTAGISTRTFYRWRARYSGLAPRAARERNDLLRENIRLRAFVQELLRKGQGAATIENRAISERMSAGSALPPAPAREGRSTGRFAAVRGQR